MNELPDGYTFLTIAREPGNGGTLRYQSSDILGIRPEYDYDPDEAYLCLRVPVIYEGGKMLPTDATAYLSVPLVAGVIEELQAFLDRQKAIGDEE